MISDFVEILERKLLNDITQEIDYRYSDEGLREELMCNEYFEDGSVA